MTARAMPWRPLLWLGLSMLILTARCGSLCWIVSVVFVFLVCVLCLLSVARACACVDVQP